MKVNLMLLWSLGLALQVGVGGGSVTAASTKPVKPDIPADYAPQSHEFTDKSVGGQFMGMSHLRGRLLKLHDGTEAIYIVEAPQGEFKGDPLLAGDLIIGVTGGAKNAELTTLFKRAADRAIRSNGTLTFVRWRKGVTETVSITFEGTPIPDLTKGGEPDPTRFSWNLGTTGAAGWIWAIPHISTEGSRQIYVTQVMKGSPAEGVLGVGDVILGAFGKAFVGDARKEFAAALTEAETTERQGKLVLTVWKDGTTREVSVPLKMMGNYSDTTPFGCAKTRQVMDAACLYLKTNGIGNGITGTVNALGLLSSGREDVMPIVKAYVHNIASAATNLEFRLAKESWSWGYNNLLLTEYYLATKDEAVLPAIREYSTKLAKGQSRNGNWGHSMCVPWDFASGRIEGICPGYGALNQAGLPCMISIVLATKCGITNEPIGLAVKRGSDFFRFYSERGAVPYGDHSPIIDCHDDNGKTSLAAVLCDLLGEKAAATFFTKMTIASFNEREGGHSGNYFSLLWGPLGAARGGEAATSAFMKRMDWFFDLERRGQGNFIYQGKPGMADTRSTEHQYKGWDCTGARLLAYSLPLKKLYITGKGRTIDDIVGKELAEVVEAGELTAKRYEALSADELLAKLGSWSPAVRSRAAMALEKKPDNVVTQLVSMLDSGNRYARYGACQGLCYAGRASAQAADAIVTKGMASSDQTMKFFAMRAFGSYDEKMGLSAVAGRALPGMLKLAANSDPDDVGGRMKGELAFCLFYSGNAIKVKALARKGEGLAKVNSDVVVDAIRVLLKVDNGGQRSCVANTYGQLTDEQLKRLWADIYRAVRQQAPADIMYSNPVRIEGIRLMAKHHALEGLDLAVWFLTNQKKHGMADASEDVLKLIVQQYGGHARSKIQDLKNFEKQFAVKKSNEKILGSIRGAIQSIESAPKPDREMVSIAEFLK